MSGALLMRELRDAGDRSLSPYTMANLMRADSTFMDGLHRGLDDWKAGRVTPWVKVKKELGIGKR